MVSSYDIDALDRSIIREMVVSPRRSVLQLARALGVARNTAQARLDRLQERGIITGFGPDIDLVRVGYRVMAFVSLEIAQGQGPLVVERLHQHPEVVEAYMTTGQADLLCRVAARDNDHLGHLINQILEIPGISRVTTSLVLATRIAPRVLGLVTASTD